MSFVIKGVQIEAKVEHGADTSLATVVGKAENANFITLNGREIYIDKDGSFKESIALIPGVSVVTIKAKDKFGNNKEKKFQIVYKESAPSVAMN